MTLESLIKLPEKPELMKKLGVNITQPLLDYYFTQSL